MDCTGIIDTCFKASILHANVDNYITVVDWMNSNLLSVNHYLPFIVI